MYCHLCGIAPLRLLHPLDHPLDHQLLHPLDHPLDHLLPHLLDHPLDHLRPHGVLTQCTDPMQMVWNFWKLNDEMTSKTRRTTASRRPTEEPAQSERKSSGNGNSMNDGIDLGPDNPGGYANRNCAELSATVIPKILQSFTALNPTTFTGNTRDVANGNTHTTGTTWNL